MYNPAPLSCTPLTACSSLKIIISYYSFYYGSLFVKTSKKHRLPVPFYNARNREAHAVSGTQKFPLPLQQRIDPAEIIFDVFHILETADGLAGPAFLICHQLRG